MRKRAVSCLAMLILLASCVRARPSDECAMPSLSEAEVRAIARRYLLAHGENAEFMETAQSKVRESGCRYLYEERESFERFGQGVTVEISRRRQVTDEWILH